MKRFGIFFLTLFLVSCNSSQLSPIMTLSGKTLSENSTKEEIFPQGKGIEAAGTEPFWAFRYEDNSVLWQTPGENKINSDIISVGVQFSSTHIQFSGEDFSADITSDTSCSDGMSDNTYDFSVKVTKGKEQYTWCGRWYNAK